MCVISYEVQCVCVCDLVRGYRGGTTLQTVQTKSQQYPKNFLGFNGGVLGIPEVLGIKCIDEFCLITRLQGVCVTLHIMQKFPI